MHTKRVPTIVLALVLVAAGMAVVTRHSAAAAAPPGAGAFVPLVPRRILDTRDHTGGPIPSGGTITLQVAGFTGVPQDAVAVALNLTATNTTLPGFVTAWPSGEQRPTVSNLNVTEADQTIANFAVVRVGQGGRITFYALNQLDLVADIAGYWTTANEASAGRYIPAGPTRVLDTRSGLGAGPVPGNGSIDAKVTAPAPQGAEAVILNLTATDAQGPGFVTAWPTGKARPLASNVNVTHAGQTIPNLVMVPIGANGQVSFFSNRPIDLVADVLGYFTAPGAPTSDDGLFVPVSPERILDTRQAGGQVHSEGHYDLVVAGHAGVPVTGASAVIANLTATNPSGPGFVTVYPAGSEIPLASNLNVEAAGQTIPNLTVDRLGHGGGVTFRAIMDVDLIFDVAGWFTQGQGAPPPPPTTAPQPGTTTIVLPPATTEEPPAPTTTTTIRERPTTTTTTTAPKPGTTTTTAKGATTTTTTTPATTTTLPPTTTTTAPGATTTTTTVILPPPTTEPPPDDSWKAPPIPPGEGQITCSSWTTWRAAQDWFDWNFTKLKDPAGLDPDGNLIACENLPGAPFGPGAGGQGNEPDKVQQSVSEFSGPNPDGTIGRFSAERDFECFTSAPMPLFGSATSTIAPVAPLVDHYCFRRELHLIPGSLDTPGGDGLATGDFFVTAHTTEPPAIQQVTDGQFCNFSRFPDAWTLTNSHEVVNTDGSVYLSCRATLADVSPPPTT